MSKRIPGRPWLLSICAFGLLSGQCDVPSGSSVEVATNNPYISNLIDTTSPPSLMVLESSSFQTLTVYFSEAVDRTSFSLADHVRVEVIENFWAGASSWRTTEVSGFFLPALAWDCDRSLPVCRTENPEYDPDAATRLVLTVDEGKRENFTGTLETPYYYRVEILGRCDETPSPAEPCAASPLTSHDDYPLEVPARVYVGVVHDGEVSPAMTGPRPTVTGWWPPELVFTPGAYIPPHQRLEVYFSDHMGAVNPSPNLLEGINFRLFHDDPEHPNVTTLKNESSQGLLPGTLYELLLLSAELAPAFTPGLPPTINRYGTALGSGNQLEDPAVTQAFVFETAHVRILLPWQEAYSDEPAAWDRQLAEWGYTNPVILVEVAPGVTRLSASMAGGETGIEFEDVLLDGMGGVVEIPITRIAGTAQEPTWRHLLRVHAFAGIDWRGADELKVYHCPYPQSPDPLPPFLLYRLSGALYMDPPDAEDPRPLYDLDDDTLADALETELAMLAKPFLVLDEEEGCFFEGQDQSSLGWKVVGDPTLFFQVRPVGRAGSCREANNEGRCVQQVRLTYVMTYQQDCGEEGWGNHHGDTEPIELLLRSTDGGVTWEVVRVGVAAHEAFNTYEKETLLANLDPDPVQACVEEWPWQGTPEGERFEISRDDKIYQCADAFGVRHLVVLVAADKHANYLRVVACDSGGDQCAGGFRVFAPLPDNFLDAQRNNVGEPVVSFDENPDSRWDCDGDGLLDDSRGGNLILGDLGVGGYGHFFLEWIWQRAYDDPAAGSLGCEDLPCADHFCGGMRSRGMRCETSKTEENPAGNPEYCVPDPTSCIQTTSNCDGGIIEGKLAFDPFCSCQVFP